MTAPAVARKTVPVIAVAVASGANARLLEGVVGDHCQLEFSLDHRPEKPPDLIIVDAASLQRHRALIARLRQRSEPTILPSLLVYDPRTGSSGGLNGELGTTVDDILRVPVSRHELAARIDNLLRLRDLSCAQEEARTRLSDMVSALQVLNACDQVMVRVENETELLQTICQNIVEVEDYKLAWIGFCESCDPKMTVIRAAAGTASEHAAELAADCRLGEIQVLDSLTDDARGKPAHQLAASRGLESAIVLPLETTRKGRGFIAIYSNRPGYFSKEEVRPLERLAINLGHALNSLHLQQEQKKQSAEIHQLAYTDALTGLPNRRYLVNYLEDMLTRSESTAVTSAAVLFIDLDGFKLINDALGHDAGDAVLIEVSRRLQHAVRETDLVIRQGGDEFLVVMLDAPRQKAPLTPEDPEGFTLLAGNLAERIIQHLSEPFTIAGEEHHLSASIGISLCPDHGDDASTVIQAADTAMYSAKKMGGSQSYLYCTEIFEERQQRLSLEARLRNAISNDELELHYQPIFDMKTRQTVGTEALVRWPQADGTMMLPGIFIPVAEESGLIVSLGNWVLKSAARQLQTWHADGYKLHMAVNMSIHQLHPDGDAEQIADLIRPYVDPAWITLEITESVLMKKPVEIEELLNRLHEQGFRIAIDDFGTGYSSLSRLQHLPLQTLKIDRSFVNELNPGGKGAGMISIIQQMASSFGLRMVAEGIENEDQYDHLRAAGVEMGQGFWYGRPVPESQIRQRLTRT